jgi:hypothetical protein
MEPFGGEQQFASLQRIREQTPMCSSYNNPLQSLSKVEGLGIRTGGALVSNPVSGAIRLVN